MIGSANVAGCCDFWCGYLNFKIARRNNYIIISYSNSKTLNVKHISKNNLILQLISANNYAMIQFDGLKTARRLHYDCMFLLEYRGIGMFYEFYCNKNLNDLLLSKDSILFGHGELLVC